MKSLREIFFATGNENKIREIAAIAADRLLIRSILDTGQPFEIAETESSLEGNAMLKARTWHEHSGLPCFADDTGLEVEALGGMPGVMSARYAGPENDAGRNIAKLLHEMNGQINRQARFRTVIAWKDKSSERYFEGILRGRIATKASGNSGFGYDPIFIPEGYDQSLAELPPELKNRISHRGIAMNKFMEFLAEFAWD